MLPGPTILSTVRHRRGAVGERGHRLRAADRVHAVDARDRGGGEHHGLDVTVRRGTDHDDVLDAGDFRRDRVHQHRRRIRRLAAGNVDADAIEGRHLLAEHGAVVFRVVPRCEPLPLVVGAGYGRPPSRAPAPRRIEVRKRVRRQPRNPARTSSSASPTVLRSNAFVYSTSAASPRRPDVARISRTADSTRSSSRLGPARQLEKPRLEVITPRIQPRQRNALCVHDDASPRPARAARSAA